MYLFTMWLKGCFVVYALCSTLSIEVSAVCTLPAELQTGSWEYTGGPNTPLTLTFGPSSMSGLILLGKGTQLSSYTCISNVDNVFVFRSTFPYSDRGDDRYVFLCMRLTRVSDDLFYFYLLADIDTSNTVSPQERVFNPPATIIPPDTEPTCNYCGYTTAPPDSDIRILRRSGTNNNLPNGITACLPCSATCNVVPPTTTTTTTTTTTLPPTTTTTLGSSESNEDNSSEDSSEVNTGNYGTGKDKDKPKGKNKHKGKDKLKAKRQSD